ncbi:MAG: hypothetical protein AAFR39_08225 [Pseudomonadota bacterium]
MSDHEKRIRREKEYRDRLEAALKAAKEREAQERRRREREQERDQNERGSDDNDDGPSSRHGE